MSAESIKSPTPICEACWVEKNSHWEPHSMDDQGNIMMRLRNIEIPMKYNTGIVEVCEYCGKMTVAGIYQLLERDSSFGFGLAALEDALLDLDEDEE